MASAPIITDPDALLATGAANDGVDMGEEGSGSPLAFLAQIAQSHGDISSLFDDQTLTSLGHDVVRDYELDDTAREDWKLGAEKGLKRAAQERLEADNAPAYRKSFVNYPLLTVAAQQFNARAYPAIVKTGSIVKIKVIGSDKGRPQLDQSGQPMVMLGGRTMTQQDAAHAIAQMQAQQQQAAPAPQGSPADQLTAQPAPQPQAPQLPQPVPAWQIAPGAKQKRADRVSDYMNVYIEFRMDDWEEDTDDLLNQIPIVGCGFRKLWWDAEENKQCAAFVSAMNLVVPNSAKTLDTSPRITEEMPDVFPFQIKERMNSGFYRSLVLVPEGDDEEGPRMLLEQHRLADMDGDGVDEPYIVTVDHDTSQVLRIEADFGVDDIVLSPDHDRAARIKRKCYYVKYPFLPAFKGGFYNMGFGHLLDQLGDIVNTCINQMFDAGHAQIAGGGFIAAGLRLQGNNRDEAMRWMPGEYKQVSVSSGDLRAGIVERTFPEPSNIIYQLLEMMLGAAKDITSVKDVMTGEASNTAPVGTTLALIEQGSMVFTAIYKRIYRSLGKEFSVVFDNLRTYGDAETAQDYMTVLDEQGADFQKDFADTDVDIKPVADPSSVTQMQKMAKAQFLDQMRGKGLNDQEINRRVLEAAGIEDIDALIPEQQAPDPLVLAKVRNLQTSSDLNEAKANQAGAITAKTGIEAGLKIGQGGGDLAGGISALAGQSSDPMGAGGAGSPGQGSGGNVGAGIVDSGAV